MKKKLYKGLTLIELVISFLLISFIVIMVSNAVTSSYTLSTKIKDLPNAYYKTQGTAETKISEIKELIAEKTRIENDIKNTSNRDIEQNLQKRLSEIKKELEKMENDPKNPVYKKILKKKEQGGLFGKEVEVYEFEYQYENSENSINTNLYVGLANVEPLERPTPIINNVKIAITGNNSSENNIFGGINKTASVTSVTYDSKNSDLKKKELYQWYVATENFHMMPDKKLTDAQIEAIGNKVMPQYTSSFTLIPDKDGGKNKSISIKDEYKGKFIVCVVSNISVNGKISKAVESNFLYINPLPKLTAGKYIMWIEPTLMENEYKFNEVIEVAEIKSQKTYDEIPQISLIPKDGGNLKINLRGTKTNSHDNETGSESRYLELSSGSKASLSSVLEGSNTVVYIVARDRDNPNSNVEVIKAGDQTIGFKEPDIARGKGGNTGWKVLSGSLNNLSNVEFGSENTTIEIAEIIFTLNASEDEKQSVIKYLGEKYYIHD